MFAVTADRAGESQIVVWGDEDDDDFFCSNERAGFASVGWDRPAPAATGLPPDEKDCSVAIPAPSPTPTPSASPSGPEPSPTATETPTSQERFIDIDFRHAPLIVSGRVGVADESETCIRDVPVKIQRRKGDDYITLATTSTDEHGGYLVKLRDRTGRYRAMAPRAKRAGIACEKATASERHIH